MRARLLFPLTLVAFAVLEAGCATTPPAPPHVPTAQEKLESRVEALTKKAASLLKTEALSVWRHWTTGAPLASDVKSAGASPFTPEAIRAIGHLRALEKSPAKARALERLETYFIGEWLAAGSLDLNQAIGDLEASLTFTSGGKEHAYRDLTRLLANEKSFVRRRALWADATPDVERISALIRRRDEKQASLLASIGETPSRFGASLREADLSKLHALADEILQATDAPYRTEMERLSKSELQMPFDKLHRADLPRLFRPEVVDDAFPAKDLLPRVKDTLKGLGLDLFGRKGVTFDLATRKGKNPHGLMLAIEVPGDVRVSLEPAEGVRAQRDYLHQVGHALAATYAPPSGFASAQLGDPTVREASALLFEDLMEDPVWLREQAHLDGRRLHRYLAATAIRNLFLIRRASGRLLYALALTRKPDADPKTLYRDIMSRTYGVALNEDDLARARVDRDTFFASADMLRARMLSAQLEATLKDRFGPTWWHTAKAGAFLKSLWAKGDLSPTEEAEALGAPGLKPDTLLLRLGSTLGVDMSLPADTPDAAEPPIPAEPRTTSAEAKSPVPEPKTSAGSPREDPAEGHHSDRPDGGSALGPQG